MALMRQKRFRPEDAAEKVYKIHGTDTSFSSTPDDLDYKAVDVVGKITLQVHCGELVPKTHRDIHSILETAPQNLPAEGLFLADGLSYWNSLRVDKNKAIDVDKNKAKGDGWRSHGSAFGYGIGGDGFGLFDDGFKKTYVYHQGNHKTNWIMNVYTTIDGYFNIKGTDMVLCHVFQSDNYDPKPKPRPKLVPDIFDFGIIEIDSCVDRLEGLMRNPESFKDFDDFNGTYNKCDSKWKANGRNGKRAKVWEDFTEIKVLGPDGEVMLTLAICHHCSMAYRTGKWDPKKGELINNGTKTLKKHYEDNHMGKSPQ